jgi:hypothetical protein
MQRQSNSNDSDNDDAVTAPIKDDDLHVCEEFYNSTYKLDATGSLPVRASRSGLGSSSDIGMDLETAVVAHMREHAVRQGHLKCNGALLMCMIGCAGPPTPSKYRMYHTLVIAPAFLVISTIGPSATVLL